MSPVDRATVECETRAFVHEWIQLPPASMYSRLYPGRRAGGPSPRERLGQTTTRSRRSLLRQVPSPIPAGLALLLTVGCAVGTASPRNVGGTLSLCLDGLAINSGDGTVGEILSRDVRTRRWLESAGPGTRGPLVLVDGGEVDGLQRLHAIRARDVISIETVDADRAVPEFGSRGRDGAIVVRTRGGAAGVASTPHERPRDRCSA